MAEVAAVPKTQRNPEWPTFPPAESTEVFSVSAACPEWQPFHPENWRLPAFRPWPVRGRPQGAAKTKSSARPAGGASGSPLTSVRATSASTAAISDATAIIEASDTSGTLHQAAECVRLGRWPFIAKSDLAKLRKLGCSAKKGLKLTALGTEGAIATTEEDNRA